MTQQYISKSITLPSGVVATTWAITDWSIRNISDSTKTTVMINVSGYITPSALTDKLTSVPGVRYSYRFTAENFPEGKDLTTIVLSDMYTALENYLNTTPKDPLSGGTLTSI